DIYFFCIKLADPFYFIRVWIFIHYFKTAVSFRKNIGKRFLQSHQLFFTGREVLNKNTAAPRRAFFLILILPFDDFKQNVMLKISQIKNTVKNKARRPK
ncbi:MAG: hypothetical protein G01um101444_437, partial [Parcubacteria group bacterium Gr01-1014_44]